LVQLAVAAQHLAAALADMLLHRGERRAAAEQVADSSRDVGAVAVARRRGLARLQVLHVDRIGRRGQRTKQNSRKKALPHRSGPLFLDLTGHPPTQGPPCHGPVTSANCVNNESAYCVAATRK